MSRRNRGKKATEPQVDIRSEAKKSQEEFEDDLKKLWKILQTAKPADREKIMKQLDEKTVTALRTMHNPYKKPVIDDKTNKVLLFSVINLTEKYSQRFAMTSLIGFVNRMLDEWKPAEAEEMVSENSAEFATPYNAKVKAAQRQKPDTVYRQELEDTKKRMEEVRTQLEATDLTEEKSQELRKKLGKLAKETFYVRAKIAKYQLYLLNSDVKELRDEHTKLSKELKAREDEERAHLELLRVRKVKLEKRLRVEKEGKDALKDDLKETMGADMEKAAKLRDEGKSIEDLPEAEKWAIKSKLRTVLTIQDMERSVLSFESEVTNTQADVTRVQGQVAAIKTRLAELEAQIKVLEEKIESHLGFFRALKEEYTEKINKTSKAPVAKSGKPAKALKKRAEHVHPLDEVEISKFELTEEEYDALADEVKKSLNLAKTAEEYTEEIQNHIRKFMDHHFVYNPDNHVRCSYKPNYEDPTRTPIDIDQERKEKEVKYERLLWPPDDTFFRWNRYVENNYEELRQATDDIYAEKSDFEFAIVPYKVFEGPDENKVMEEVREYQRKYADEFEADILAARFFNWNLLGSWAQNREVRDFYNKNTEIIKRILDQNKEDQQMGPKLMKDRANKEKSKNVKKDGPDAYGFNEIKKHSKTAAELERHGAKPIRDIDTSNVIKDEGPIPASSIPRDNRESTDKEVEVGVHVIKPELRRGKRRMRGVTDSFKFNIPAEELPDGAVNVSNVVDQQKKLLEDEKKGSS